PAAPTTRSLPGPTGESNRLSEIPREALLCLGPGPETVKAQVEAVRALGGVALTASGPVADDTLQQVDGISGVLWWGDSDTARGIEKALARRDGPIVPLIPGRPDRARVLGERHVCVDTTAAGGNAALLGGMA
ncbi:bifunctional proline dehydrogenase/L-glutamate gamma-semialdehyde dehydrogenase, partial [Cribrihabitans sp. XS_ASV171]